MYSEQEMKDFFQNVVDQVATLSTQASKVDGLEQRIIVMSERLHNLEQANAQLQHDLVQSNNVIRETQTRLEASQRDFDNERAVTASLRDVITGRDNKVQELEQHNQVERDAHKVTLSERDDARRRGEELETQVNSFRVSLEDTIKERDEWKEKCLRAEAEVTDLKQKLDRVSAILSPLRAISGDVQAVG
jgi:chromosome segregation ATPase